MIDHVSLSVSDLGVSSAFYEKVLGAIDMVFSANKKYRKDGQR